MQVILLERIEKLGQMGDVVRVKDGYARNFLLPQQKALRATEENVGSFEKQKTQLQAVNLDRRKEAEAVGAKLDGLKCVLLRQASEGGQLYGSVKARDIAAAVTEAGFTVDRKQVLLTAVIKTLGIHEVRIALHPEVAIGVSVNVARSVAEAEAEAQAKGRDPAAAEAAPSDEAAEEIFETSELAAKAEAEDATAEKEDESPPAEGAAAKADGEAGEAKSE